MTPLTEDTCATALILSCHNRRAGAVVQYQFCRRWSRPCGTGRTGGRAFSREPGAAAGLGLAYHEPCPDRRYKTCKVDASKLNGEVSRTQLARPLAERSGVSRGARRARAW